MRNHHLENIHSILQIHRHAFECHDSQLYWVEGQDVRNRKGVHVAELGQPVHHTLILAESMWLRPKYLDELSTHGIIRHNTCSEKIKEQYGNVETNWLSPATSMGSSNGMDLDQHYHQSITAVPKPMTSDFVLIIPELTPRGPVRHHWVRQKPFSHLMPSH